MVSCCLQSDFFGTTIQKNSSLKIKVSGPFLSGGYGKSDPAGGGRIGSAKM